MTIREIDYKNIYKNFGGATTATWLDTGPSFLHSINVLQKTGTGFIVVNDNNTTTEAAIAKIDLSTLGSYVFDAYFTGGMYINPTGGASCTFIVSMRTID